MYHRRDQDGMSTSYDSSIARKGGVAGARNIADIRHEQQICSFLINIDMEKCRCTLRELFTHEGVKDGMGSSSRR